MTVTGAAVPMAVGQEDSTRRRTLHHDEGKGSGTARRRPCIVAKRPQPEPAPVSPVPGADPMLSARPAISHFVEAVRVTSNAANSRRVEGVIEQCGST